MIVTFKMGRYQIGPVPEALAKQTIKMFAGKPQNIRQCDLRSGHNSQIGRMFIEHEAGEMVIDVYEAH